MVTELSVSEEVVRQHVRRLERRMMNGEHDVFALAGSIERIYAEIGLAKPAIVWCESPQEFTNLPWILTVILQNNQSVWRANVIKTMARSAKSFAHQSTWRANAINAMAGSDRTFVQPVAPQLWQRVEQCLSTESRPRDLGPMLNSQFTDMLMYKMSPMLGQQAELVVSPYTKLQIDRRLQQTILRIIQRLKDACEPLSRVAAMPDMNYAPAIYAPPGRNWVDSTPEMLNASLRPASVFANAWGAGALYWLLTYECIRAESQTPVFSEELNRQLDDWLQLLNNGQMYAFFEHFCFVCAYPATMMVDENVRLHNATGPALKFRDGQKYYFWHGTSIAADMIEARKFIRPWRIDIEPNIERRRIMMEIFGFENYVRKSKRKVIHKDECGILYRKQVRGDEPIVVVEVINSSPEPDGTYKRYMLRVPPNITTARAAVAWTFGMNPSEYKPGVET